MMHALILDAALKGTSLLLLVAGLTFALRRASAASRHFVWGIGLTGLLLLPVLSTLLPWQLPVLPARATTSAQPADEPQDRVSAAPPVTVATEEVVSSAPRTAYGVPAGPAPSAPLDLRTIAIGLWLAGVLLALGRLTAGLIAVWRLTRRAAPVLEPEWSNALTHAARQLGVTTPVRLLRSAATHLPLTAGTWRPVIVLPAESTGWVNERRHAVLLHELAHVRRGDVLTQLIALAAAAVYWFHPLVWLAVRRLRAEGERACDDLVLTAGTRASAYAGHLLQLVRAAGRLRAPLLALPMAQRSDFEGRLLAILEPDLARRPLTRRRAAIAATAILVATVPLAALRAAQAPQDPQTPQDPQPRVVTRSRPQVQVEVAKQVQRQARVQIAQITSEQIQQAVTSGIAQALGTDPVIVGDWTPQDARVSPAVIRGLIAALGDADIEVRTAAARSLGQLEDSAAIAALSEALLRDADAEVRKMSAWALGEIEDARAVQALSQALRSDREVEVRRMAAWALGEIEDPAAVDALGAALRDADAEVRKTSVWALGEIESPRAVPLLIPVLGDTSAEVRQQAAWALGEIESPDAIDALTTAMRDRNVSVREMVVWALGEIEDARAVPALTIALRDTSVAVRRKAVWAIGEIDNLHQAPPGLLEALKDSDSEVRQQAAHAAGELGDAAAVPGLILLLKDADVDVRRAAIQALGEIDSDTAFDALVAALRDTDPVVRRAAAHALGRN